MWQRLKVHTAFFLKDVSSFPYEPQKAWIHTKSTAFVEIEIRPCVKGATIGGGEDETPLPCVNFFKTTHGNLFQKHIFYNENLEAESRYNINREIPESSI